MGSSLNDSLVRLRRFLRTGLEGSRYHAGGVGGAGAKFSSESAPTIHALVEGPMAYMVMEELTFILKSSQKCQWQAACPEAIAYSLALCAASDHRPTKAAAYTIFPEICKSPVLLFAVTRYLEQVSEGTGWGRAHRRAVAHWYSATEFSNARELAVQATRVVRRHRWTHADLLRLAHVKPTQFKPGVDVLLRYLTRGLPAAIKMVEEKEAEGGGVEDEARDVLAYLQAVEEVRHTKDEQVAARLMEEYQLALEHVPSHLLRSKEVWMFLVRRLPLHELVTHMPRLSRAGLLARGPLVGALRERLQSACEDRPPRLGPLETYALKRSLEAGRPKHHNHHHRSSSSLQLDEVVSALHELSYRVQLLQREIPLVQAVPATGRRYLVAVDVRGPMTHGRCRGLDGLTPAEVSALLLRALVRSRDEITAVAFSARGLAPLDLDARMSLADISQRLRETPMGPVDLSLPLRWACEQKRVFDLVLVCTDNQTQSWSVHPAQALKEYRESCSHRGAKFAVCAMCSQGFSLAAPDELGMLDIAGCDGRTIHLIQDFAAGLF